MSDPIMQKLDEMQALTDSSPVPLGVSIARHVDRLLAETRLELRTCIAALRDVSTEHAPESLDLLHPDCAEGTCDHDPDDPENPSDCPVFKATVCSGCLDLAERAWRYYGEEGVEAVEYPCPTVKAITKALGVEV